MRPLPFGRRSAASRGLAQRTRRFSRDTRISVTPPMPTNGPMPYGRQLIEEDDVVAVAEALRSEWLTTGPMVERFEKALAERCGARYAVVVNSGTAALQAAYHAAGVGPGAEVIVPPLTFAATANAALLLGAEPVFVDIDPHTLTLDPVKTREKLGPKTRVIAPVDYAGEPAAIGDFMAMARGRGILVVEDASHALGARLCGSPVGSLADLTVFSFHPVKHITTSEGGAVLTDDPELARMAREFRSHGILRPADPATCAEGAWFYEIVEVGQNFRLPDVLCALGLSQLGKLDRFLARRRDIAKTYRDAFSSDPRLVLPPARDYDAHAWHLYPLRLRDQTPPRREVFDRLRQAGIGVQVHYVPVNGFKLYRERGHSPEETPNALDAYERLISIPIFPAMTDAQVQRVIAAVKEALS